jgi:hypothetical protein
MMAGVYSELRGFVLAPRRCTGPRHADVDPVTPNPNPKINVEWRRGSEAERPPVRSCRGWI